MARLGDYSSQHLWRWKFISRHQHGDDIDDEDKKKVIWWMDLRGNVFSDQFSIFSILLQHNKLVLQKVWTRCISAYLGSSPQSKNQNIMLCYELVMNNEKKGITLAQG